MVVLKFGGTSLRDYPYQVLSRIMGAASRSNKQQVVVVVSALAGITDALWQRNLSRVREILHKWKKDHSIHGSVMQTISKPMETLRKHLLADANSKTPPSNLLVSLGEKISALLISDMLDMHGVSSLALWADVNMLCVQQSKGTKTLRCNIKRVRTCLEKGIVPVVTGYCAFDEASCQTQLLGRNGSDTTATILAQNLKQDCTIFTDVQGIYTTDPRLCEFAVPVREMTFGEIRELAFHGASVLHGECIDYAEKNSDRKLTVAHVSDRGWRRRGTLVTSYLSCERDSHVIALAVLQNRIGVSVRAECGTVGFACKVFQRIGAECVSVEMFSQTCSERSICIIVPESARTKVAKALKEYTVEFSENLCILTVVGESMRNTPGVAADVCTAISARGINIRCISQGASEMSLSIAVPQCNLREAVEAVHDIIV